MSTLILVRTTQAPAATGAQREVRHVTCAQYKHQTTTPRRTLQEAICKLIRDAQRVSVGSINGEEKDALLDEGRRSCWPEARPTRVA